MSAVGKRYVIAFNGTAESSIVNFTDKFKFHYEEADALIVLHCTDVAKSNTFCHLYVACADTDVLLLLLYFYPQICSNTVFHATIREIVAIYYTRYRRRMYAKCIKAVRIMALLGFHAFLGCNLTGRFSGFSKTTCFDTFLKSNSYIHETFNSLGNNNNGLK